MAYGRYFSTNGEIKSLDGASSETLSDMFNILAKYVQTSIRVCKQLCLQQHDDLCNSVVYNYTSKTCFVSKMVGPENDYQTPDRITTDEVDTFIRKRCNGKSFQMAYSCAIKYKLSLQV